MQKFSGGRLRAQIHKLQRIVIVHQLHCNAVCSLHLDQDPAHITRFSRIVSLYHFALSFGVRCCVLKSVW
jgi:hypothetical protein